MNGDDDDEVLTLAETKRVLTELVESSQPAGIPKDDLETAHDRFCDVVAAAQTVATWQDGLIAVGWDASKRELTWRSTRFGPVAEGGGLL